MQVAAAAGELEGIPAAIARRVESADVVDTMQRLVDVAEQVNEPAQRVDLFLVRSSARLEEVAELGDLRNDVRLGGQRRIHWSTRLERDVDKMERLGERLRISNIVGERG